MVGSFYDSACGEAFSFFRSLYNRPLPDLAIQPNNRRTVWRSGTATVIADNLAGARGRSALLRVLGEGCSYPSDVLQLELVDSPAIFRKFESSSRRKAFSLMPQGFLSRIYSHH